MGGPGERRLGAVGGGSHHAELGVGAVRGEHEQADDDAIARRIRTGERGEDANRVGRQRVVCSAPMAPAPSTRIQRSDAPSSPNNTRPSPARSMCTSVSSASGVVPGITSWRVTLQPLSSGLGWQPAEREAPAKMTMRAPAAAVAKVRPWLRRRGTSCTSCRCRRGRDRCGRPWARSRRTGLPSSVAAGWPSPAAGARRGAAARFDRRARALRRWAAGVCGAGLLARADLHVEQLLADVAADAAHHLAEDRRSLPSCTPASDPSGRSRAGRCPRAAPPST